jgi:GntR family transcriptional repressor for pyruvate dehydrogenase complex
VSSLSTGVVEALRQQIVSGQLRPGDKLPAESALEQDFRVSRTVIREALSRLQSAGLVEKYRGKGTFVLTMPSSHAFAAPSQQAQSHQDRLDLLDFRLGVEVEAAALAARRRSTAQLTAISAALDAFAESRHKPSAAVTADFGFHRSIAIAADNRFYLDLLESLGTTMIFMPQTRLAHAGDDAKDAHFSRVLEEHRVILDAIRRQDPQGSAAAMRTHLSGSRARLAPGTG